MVLSSEGEEEDEVAATTVRSTGGVGGRGGAGGASIGSKTKKGRTSSGDAEQGQGGATAASRKKQKKQKRKVVKLADDADQVLKRCRKLREKLIREHKFDNAAIASSSPAAAAAAATELNRDVDVEKEKPFGIPSDIVEVSELRETEVLDGMESIALTIARQVLNKKGFSFDIPSRAASNQIYVKEWDRIVLGGKRMTRSFLNVKESRKSAITLRVLQLLHAGEGPFSAVTGKFSYFFFHWIG